MQRLGQLVECTKGEIFLRPLDSPDVRAVQIALGGEYLLRPAALVPHRDHLPREHVPFIFTAVRIKSNVNYTVKGTVPLVDENGSLYQTVSDANEASDLT